MTSSAAPSASAWRAHLWPAAATGSVLRLSQPLRAESGAAHLRIPAGRTKYREVIHRAHKLELTPSGRNLQVEAEYRIPFAGGNLRAGLGFDRHANHDRARDLETFLRLGFERRF